jgi:hypothetical protein
MVSVKRKRGPAENWLQRVGPVVCAVVDGAVAECHADVRVGESPRIGGLQVGGR